MVSPRPVLDFVRFRPVATVGQVRATDIRTREGSDLQADLRLRVANLVSLWLVTFPPAFGSGMCSLPFRFCCAFLHFFFSYLHNHFACLDLAAVYTFIFFTLSFDGPNSRMVPILLELEQVGVVWREWGQLGCFIGSRAFQ